jgi:putative membrane protein
VIRAASLASGLVLLAILWIGPLPAMAPASFTAHMTLHMGVVAVAAPLLAAGLAGGTADPARMAPRLVSALPAAALELAVVWAWHAPVLHHLARTSNGWLVAEQASFLGAGLLVWVAAIGGGSHRAGARTGSGVVALLLTSMHMTLLGALLALAPRPLYHHDPVPLAALTALEDQHLGGAIMLIVGGVSYLIGGLLLSRRLLALPGMGRAA